MNLELAHQEIQDLKAATRKDGEDIRALTPIARDTLDSIRSLESTARAHEERLDNLEGQ